MGQQHEMCRPGLKTPSWMVSLVCFCLAMLTFLAFLPVLWCDFINLDDDVYLKNAAVLSSQGWTGICHALTGNVLQLWHPLSTLSFMVDYSLFGLNATPYHLENLLIHVLNGVLLFLALQKMTGATWRSAATAAFFAIHPLRVESVAWVAERKDLLSTLFCILALLAYTWYCRQGNHWWAYVLVLICMCLSLMAKPMFVTLPFVLLLLDYWPLGRIPGIMACKDQGRVMRMRRTAWLAMEKVPLFALSLGVTWYVMTANWATPKISAVGPFPDYPLGLRLANGLISCIRYLGKLVWFGDLAIWYPMPESWPLWQVTVASMVLAAISVGVLVWIRRVPHLFVGWFWYLGILLPALGVVAQIAGYSLADRYTYVASVGITVMLIWAIPDRWAHSPSRRSAVGGVFAVLVLVLGIFTAIQCAYWKDSITVFGHALDVTHDNALAHYNLGEALAQQKHYDQAIPHFERVRRLLPASNLAHHNLGVVFSALGRTDDAISAFARAVALTPDDDRSMVCWGDVLCSQGKSDQAIQRYRQAIQVRPTNAQAHIALGMELEERGELEAAVASYQAALDVNSGDLQAHTNIAGPLLKLGRIDEMLQHCEQAIKLNPRSPEAHYNMAIGLLRRNRTVEAIAHLKAAVEADHGNPAIRRTLAAVLAGQESAQRPDDDGSLR